MINEYSKQSDMYAFEVHSPEKKKKKKKGSQHPAAFGYPSIQTLFVIMLGGVRPRREAAVSSSQNLRNIPAPLSVAFIDESKTVQTFSVNPSNPQSCRSPPFE